MASLGVMMTSHTNFRKGPKPLLSSVFSVLSVLSVMNYPASSSRLD